MRTGLLFFFCEKKKKMFSKGPNPAKDAILSGREKFAMGESIHVMGETLSTSLCFIDLSSRHDKMYCRKVIEQACRLLDELDILKGLSPKTMGLRNGNGELIHYYAMIGGGEIVHLCSVKGNNSNNNEPPPSTLVMCMAADGSETYV